MHPFWQVAAILFILFFQSSWWKIASAARNSASPKQQRPPLPSLLSLSFFHVLNHTRTYRFWCIVEPFTTSQSQPLVLRVVFTQNQWSTSRTIAKNCRLMNLQLDHYRHYEYYCKNNLVNKISNVLIK